MAAADTGTCAAMLAAEPLAGCVGSAYPQHLPTGWPVTLR